MHRKVNGNFPNFIWRARLAARSAFLREAQRIVFDVVVDNQFAVIGAHLCAPHSDQAAVRKKNARWSLLNGGIIASQAREFLGADRFEAARVPGDFTAPSNHFFAANVPPKEI